MKIGSREYDLLSKNSVNVIFVVLAKLVRITRIGIRAGCEGATIG